MKQNKLSILLCLLSYLLVACSSLNSDLKMTYEAKSLLKQAISANIEADSICLPDGSDRREYITVILNNNYEIVQYSVSKPYDDSKDVEYMYYFEELNPESERLFLAEVKSRNGQCLTYSFGEIVE